jgi:hypothetical protein
VAVVAVMTLAGHMQEVQVTHHLLRQCKVMLVVKEMHLEQTPVAVADHHQWAKTLF